MTAGILLYNFTKEEEQEWSLALKPVAPVWGKFVSKDQYGLLIRQLINDDEYDKNVVSEAPVKDFDGRMLVLVNATGGLFQYLLAVCGMITDQHVYRAVLTKTNQAWNSSYLYYHLVEEEQEILTKKASEELF